LARPSATAAVACVGKANTSHTRCIRAIASVLAHKRRPITQLFRFIRPAKWMSSKRNRFIRAVRSSAAKHKPREAGQKGLSGNALREG